MNIDVDIHSRLFDNGTNCTLRIKFIIEINNLHGLCADKIADIIRAANIFIKFETKWNEENM